MKSVMLFLAKVFANEKWEIHRVVLSALIEGGEVETQGSPGSRVDPDDFVKKRGVQHREGEDYVRSLEGTVKHV